jgi:hypothetical protein
MEFCTEKIEIMERKLTERNIRRKLVFAVEVQESSDRKAHTSSTGQNKC